MLTGRGIEPREQAHQPWGPEKSGWSMIVGANPMSNETYAFCFLNIDFCPFCGDKLPVMRLEGKKWVTPAVKETES